MHIELAAVAGDEDKHNRNPSSCRLLQLLELTTLFNNNTRLSTLICYIGSNQDIL